MATLLLIIIFIAYIGLGIPDSLLGAAWPAIYTEFGLPVSYASYITILTSCGTIISSFFSAKIIKRLGTAKITAFSTTLTALALLGFSLSGNMLCLCLCAIPLGLGAGSIDTALNNYVALHYKASHMSFLHCFYGVGVTVSPYLMSFALSENNNWRGGYRIMFIIQISIAALTILSMPLWKKVGQNQPEEENTIRTLTTKQILTTRGTMPVIGIFIFSCAIECICLVWGSTFLVEANGITADKAAGIITFYFMGMTVGRFISGLLAKRISGIKIVMTGQIITFIAIMLTLIPNSVVLSSVGLSLIGLGNGPLYPNMTHLTPQVFGRDVSQSIIGFQMALTYVGIMLSPLIFGLLAEYIGVFLMPYYLITMYALMMLCTFILLPLLKSKKII